MWAALIPKDFLQQYQLLMLTQEKYEEKAINGATF